MAEATGLSGLWRLLTQFLTEGWYDRIDVIDFEKIGKYKITGKLGQGSFGVVYQGRDAYLKRDVAIKVCSVEDEGLRKRFFREAEISGKLEHKHIVTVYEFGFEGDIPYLVQEMLSGEDLSRIVKRRDPVAPGGKLEILLEVANGLGYAHTEGVIHRDIKPGNIRVLEDGRIKIMDFGIAKLASAETQLTQKGVTMGTASYLPPEQVRGAELDRRADIFSFGVLAYELLTFERPFRGNTLSALIYQILYKVPRPMSDVWPECPAALSDLIAKCLEKKPGRRHGSFAELIPELSALREDVLAGKWPDLQAAAAADRATPGPQHDPSGVLSQAAIAQTARGVLEGKVGEYTISTAVSPQEILRSGLTESGRSTRPMEAMPAEAPQTEETPPGEPQDADAALKTRVLATPPMIETPPAPASPAPAADDASEDLTMKAREIIDLVARGELEAETAKEQLEATINRQDLADLAASEADGSPPEGLAADTQKTRVMPLEKAAADRPPAGTAATADAVRPPPAVPADNAKSDTYRTVFRPPFGRLQWAGIAAAAVLAAGLGWLILRGGGESAVEPIQVPPPPPPPIVEAAVAPPAVGAVAILATPWAEVTEITDAEGYVLELPENAQTPLYLELPPGRYRIQLQDPEGTEIHSCELEVALDQVAGCTSAFGEPNVTEYFKESGWWD